MTPVDQANFRALLARAGKALRDDEAAWERFVGGLPPPVLRRMIDEFFEWQTHRGQDVPQGQWRTWLLMAGRGFGKTRTGAQWVTDRARENPGARIALVGGGHDEVVKVMIEGPSGLLAVARTGEAPRWAPTRGILRFASGAEAFPYSAHAPEKLRGPEHHFAWADELAKWENADATFDNLMMGLRLGERPQLMVSTTPRAVAIVRRIRALKGIVETHGRTDGNVHLSQAFLDWAGETYGGTRLGRQELDGILFEEPEAALWPRHVIEAARAEDPLPSGFLERVVIGVDPPASADGDACGIVVCGLGRDDVAYVLADESVTGLRPEGWARAVARAAERWDADRIVAEKNQGGDMVESVLMSADAGLPVRLVSASRGKAARAEPIAARFENGRAKLAGRFPALEDEMAGLSVGGGYAPSGQAGRSPDRADAMVWAMTELAEPARVPQIRRL